MKSMTTPRFLSVKRAEETLFIDDKSQKIEYDLDLDRCSILQLTGKPCFYAFTLQYVIRFFKLQLPS